MVELRLIVDNKERTFNSGKMEKNFFINYCDSHRKTQISKFHKSDFAQMTEYAGCPENYPAPEEVMKGFQNFYPLHESMKELVDLARERQ